MEATTTGVKIVSPQEGAEGFLGSIGEVAVNLLSTPIDLRYDGSITLVIVGMIDTCMWIWAVYALIKRYLALEALFMRLPSENA